MPADDATDVGEKLEDARRRTQPLHRLVRGVDIGLEGVRRGEARHRHPLAQLAEVAELPPDDGSHSLRLLGREVFGGHAATVSAQSEDDNR
jgi:hypothetical protein